GLAIVEAGAREGLAQHDRLILARALLARKCRGRRETSHLPALAELLLEAPLVSVAMIAQRLAISPQAAQILVGDLGASLREITGRKRYRAWTIG
ncbi:MAG: helix-turn-helix domain-containing protein, partial [Methylocella sp.]